MWHKAHALAVTVYQATSRFPSSELYGLTSQMRRASVSIPSNISEGCGRGSSAELCRFLSISLGSASELEYQVLLAKDLGFLESGVYETISKDVTEVKRMLTSYIKKLKADS